MKSIKLLLIFVCITSLSFAQKSPRKKATDKIGTIEISIDYGAPSVRNRTIWGDLVPYDKVWRAGANENTTISFSKDVTVNGSELPAGKYGFFIIPVKEGDWIIIFNKKNDAWGAFSYKQKNDALRINTTPDFDPEIQEQLKFNVGEQTIKFAWEKARFELFITEK